MCIYAQARVKNKMSYLHIFDRPELAEFPGFPAKMNIHMNIQLHITNANL